MKVLQKHACKKEIFMWQLSSRRAIIFSHNFLLEKNILGGGSRTLGNIMPGIMWHHDTTEKYSENGTQVEQLQGKIYN